MTISAVVIDKATDRVLLKLSGEALGRHDGEGIGTEAIKQTALEIVAAIKTNAHLQVAIVVGGGNMVRGKDFAREGFDQAEADYIGMLGTVMNALALKNFIAKEGVDTRVQSAIAMGEICEPYIRLRAIRHLEKGRVVIFGAGLGTPFMTTDNTAAIRGLEIGACRIAMAKNGTDGVYDSDPRVNPDAVRFDTLTFREAISRGLQVMDTASMAHCAEHNLPIEVFDMNEPGNITRVLLGESIGTLVTP